MLEHCHRFVGPADEEAIERLLALQRQQRVDRSLDVPQDMPLAVPRHARLSESMPSTRRLLSRHIIRELLTNFNLPHRHGEDASVGLIDQRYNHALAVIEHAF
jgi:hypothetical protein